MGNNLFLLKGESGRVLFVRQLHGTVSRLPHELTLPLLLGNEGCVGHGHQRIRDGDH